MTQTKRRERKTRGNGRTEGDREPGRIWEGGKGRRGGGPEPPLDRNNRTLNLSRSYMMYPRMNMLRMHVAQFQFKGIPQQRPPVYSCVASYFYLSSFIRCYASFLFLYSIPKLSTSRVNLMYFSWCVPIPGVILDFSYPKGKIFSLRASLVMIPAQVRP